MAVLLRGSLAKGPPSDDDVSRSLGRMQRLGYAVDPHNPDHVSAYMTLRANAGRVEGKRLVVFIKSRKTPMC